MSGNLGITLLMYSSDRMFGYLCTGQGHTIIIIRHLDFSSYALYIVTADSQLGDRLTAGQQTLDLLI